MANKTLIWTIVAIIAVVGGYYLYSGGNIMNDIKSSMGGQSGDYSATTNNVAITPVPGETSSSDQIVDYVVDGLSSDVKATTQTAIDGTTVPSQAAAANSLNTNF